LKKKRPDGLSFVTEKVSAAKIRKVPTFLEKKIG
jgi:hypothetical protein